MNIVVCVKHVPDATADRKFESDNTVDRVGVDGLLSELDEYAVEQALQLKEKAGDDVEVTALCVGPEKAVDAVRKALQMGADKGVHVTDDAIAGSDYHRDLAGARQGRREDRCRDDGRPGHVRHGLAPTPPAASSRRCSPSASACRRSPSPRQVETQGDQVRIKRDGDTATEVIGATMPLVALGHRPVRRGPLPVVQGHHGGQEEAARDLVAQRPRASTPATSASSVAWTEVEDTTARPPRTAGEIVKDEDGSGATALTEFLASKKFI